ncbi:hypothetical protein K2173_000396 [Erythroxylum novogranatense]|uniref:Uncharacterized protein n=1 Tax=Erythroxylum novogranatense TaxID=1862640 RepID=A0AAV8SX37_9ROSI|nr:hypothetical protein K2173_000396 [Erythroxylum novogranatense]
MGLVATKRHEMGDLSKDEEVHFSQKIQRIVQFRHCRSPLQWQEGIFNAGTHEISGGPNPISHRLDMIIMRRCRSYLDAYMPPLVQLPLSLYF